MNGTQTVPGSNLQVCACSLCGVMIYSDEKIADLEIWKYGELDEILLAHDACAREDDEQYNRQVWSYAE